MCPRGELDLEGKEVSFSGHCCVATEPPLVSPGQMAFLSAPSKTRLLLLSSSTADIKVFIGERVREAMQPSPI